MRVAIGMAISVAIRVSKRGVYVTRPESIADAISVRARRSRDPGYGRGGSKIRIERFHDDVSVGAAIAKIVD